MLLAKWVEVVVACEINSAGIKPEGYSSSRHQKQYIRLFSTHLIVLYVLST